MNTWLRWRTTLDVVTSAMLLVAGAAVLWTTVFVAPAGTPSRTEPPLPSVPQALRGAQLKGSAEARVAIVAYSDFQCPFCATFARETLPRLSERYLQSGKVLFAFRHLPLETIHPLARKAAQLSACAGARGRFWEVHDAVFARREPLTDLALFEVAARAGMGEAEVTDCIQATATQVDADISSAGALQLRGTPVFLLGTVENEGVRVKHIIRGAQGFDKFADVIDRLLASSAS